MNVTETNRDGVGGSPPLVAPDDGSPRKRYWRACLWGVGAVVLCVLGALLGEAAVYQPVGWGGMQAAFPGMPAGVIKPVNNFAHLGADYYVPPQRGVFSFGATIENTGSRPVIIEAVTVSGSYPARLAGPVLYTTDMGQPGTPRTHVLHNVALGPERDIFIGIPLKTRPCGQTDSWITVPAFYVKERFLFFTHTVALPWSMSGAKLIMRGPGGEPGDAGTVCAPR